jgi:parallel beta-helix repeat protein
MAGAVIFFVILAVLIFRGGVFPGANQQLSGSGNVLGGLFNDIRGNATEYITGLNATPTPGAAGPPTITSGPSETIGLGFAYITFTTSEPANMTIYYGTTSGGPYTGSESHSSFHTTHSADGDHNLTGLTPGSTYYYTIQLCDSSGNCQTTSEQSFTSGTSLCACGIVYNAPGNYLVCGNLSQSAPGDCVTFNIGAATSTLDCQGHTLIGDTFTYGSANGITLNKTNNVTINNCSATLWTYGLYSNSSNFSTIINSTFYGNTVNMYFNPSHDNLVEDTTLSGHTGTAPNDANLLLDRSDSNTFRRVRLTRASGFTGGNGVYATDSNSNTFTQSTFTGALGFGVKLIGGSGNSFGQSTFADHTFVFTLENSDNNDILDNTATGDIGYSVWLTSGSSSNTIDGNDFHTTGCCAGRSVQIEGGSNSNQVTNNRLESDTNSEGIGIEESSGNTISNNQIINHGVGISLRSGDSNTLTLNTITQPFGTALAINVYDSGGDQPNGNTISGNILTATGGYNPPGGLSVGCTLCSGNTVTGNTITDSGGSTSIFVYENTGGGGNSCPAGTCYQGCLEPPPGSCAAVICSISDWSPADCV